MKFLSNPFSRTFTSEEQEQFSYLRNFPLFHNLTDRQLALFLPHLHDRRYVRDEMVFFRNDPSHALYLLRKGRVKLTLDIYENWEELNVVEPYRMLGENCLIPDTKRPMNAEVVSETAHFHVIPKDSILAIFGSNPGVKVKMMESLAIINEQYLKEVFKYYRHSYGLFNLSGVYRD